MPVLNINETTLTPSDRTWIEVAVTDVGECALSHDHGVVIDNDLDIQSLDQATLEAGAIILSFPKFADGRAYSQARHLRERLSFRGKIIARGDVLPDQILFMARCGFDAVDIAHNDVTSFEHALGEFSCFYQAGADGAQPVWQKRKRARRAAA